MAPRGRILPGRSAGSLTAATAACLAAALPVIIPLVGIGLLAAAGSGNEHAPGAGVPRAAALGRSLAVAAVAAAFAYAVGRPAGALLARRLGRRGGIPLVALAALPLAVPPFIAAYAWCSIAQTGALAFARPILLGRLQGGTEVGGLFAGVVLGACLWPLVALLTARSVRAVDADAVDAARVHLGDAAAERMVRAACRPAALVGAAWVGVLALGNATVPGLLGAPAYAAEGLARLVAEADPRVALEASVPVAVVALLALALARRGLPDLAPSGRPYAPAPRGGAAERMALLVGVAAGFFAPAGYMAAGVGSLAPWTDALDLGKRALADSAAVAVLAAALALAAGTVVAWWAPSAPRRLRTGIETASLLAFVLPSYAVGAGWVHALARPAVPAALYDSPLRLAVAVASCLLFPSYLALRTAFCSLPREALDAAATAGLPPRAVLLRVALPARAPFVVATGLALAVLGLGELGVAVVREPAGFPTAQVFLWNQMHYGRDATVFALALYLVALAGGLALLAAWAAGRD